MGMGPAGELRYPSYPEGDGRWRFPGVGEFQCYDRFMLANLKESAALAKRPEWLAPPSFYSISSVFTEFVAIRSAKCQLS